MLMKSFRSFYINYLFLLILSVVPFASAQDTKLPPDVRLSEGSKLDKSQAGYYRMKIGRIDVIALTDGTIGVDFLALLTNTKPGEVESLLAREYVKREKAPEPTKTFFKQAAAGKNSCSHPSHSLPAPKNSSSTFALSNPDIGPQSSQSARAALII